jgi:hypothetical protein
MHHDIRNTMNDFMVLVSGGTFSFKLKSHNMTRAGPLSSSPSMLKSDTGYQTPISITPGDSSGGYVSRIPFASRGIFMSLKMIACVLTVIA